MESTNFMAAEALVRGGEGRAVFYWNEEPEEKENEEEKKYYGGREKKTGEKTERKNHDKNRERKWDKYEVKWAEAFTRELN